MPIKFNFALIFLLLPLVFYTCLANKKTIKYTAKYTLTDSVNINQLDTTGFGDTLFLIKNNSGIPLYYFQKIHTGVCFDNKCRLLDILIYWHITGRYRGFELPPGEFLSKTDHEPFDAGEYERLNEILQNPAIPFNKISYNQLMKETPSNNPEIDGISGATSEAVSEYVIKGAAYTTYKIWKIVYGPTQDFIKYFTKKHLSPSVIFSILRNPDNTDKVWAMEQIDERINLTPELSEQLLKFIGGNDFYLAYSAINAIDPIHLDDEKLQDSIFSKYRKADPSIRSLILNKLKKAPFIAEGIVVNSRNMLKELNGKDLGDFLKLYSTHEVRDEETLNEISKLLDHENSFISRQAREFLKNQE